MAGTTTAESTATRAEEALTWSRSLTEPALRAAVDTLPREMREISGYHLGWWDEHGRPLHAGGGKALRPALTLLAAEAVGGSARTALPAAVAVELVHNFSLLHDDVLDGDETRRSRPTAWRAFGVSAAILAGDSLLSLASSVLVDSGHPASGEAVRLLALAVQELIDGQTADLALERRAEVDLVECEAMARGKTGALLAGACELGALFGGASEQRRDHLHAFGGELGLAFQHVDDLLGIWGDPAQTGKPVHSDLRSGKKTLPVVYALTSDTPHGRELAADYHRTPPRSPAELAHTADLVAHAGGRAWSRQQADTLHDSALAHLRAAEPAHRVEELEALARLATRRER